MKKPVILHCINHLGLGGAEILLKNTVKQLDCYDHVICYLKYPHTLATAFNSSPVYHLNYTSFFKSFQAINVFGKSLNDITLMLYIAIYFTVHFSQDLLVREKVNWCLPCITF
jgi:hypothetical protein